MESPAKAILILLDASAPAAPAAAAARHGVAASGAIIRPSARQAAPSAASAPNARRDRPRAPAPDPIADRNTIRQPLRAAQDQCLGRRLSPPAGVSAFNSVAKRNRTGQAVCYLSSSVRITLLSSPSVTANGEARAKAGMSDSAANRASAGQVSGVVSGAVSGVTATAIVIADMVGIG